ILSGRPLGEIKSLVNISGLFYGGNHGLEITGPGLDFTHSNAISARPLIASIADKLAQVFTGIGGIYLENKTFSLSLHYRNAAPELTKQIRQIFNAAVAPFTKNHQVIITEGKMVLEVRPPASWNKGHALLKIRNHIAKKTQGPLLTIFLGDDATDEDAFKVLSPPDVGIYVGNPQKKSAARYHLADTAAVAGFLEKLNSLPA
ncbi:trehalose-phosphatase, partial [Chloroflexota bacterium]